MLLSLTSMKPLSPCKDTCAVRGQASQSFCNASCVISCMKGCVSSTGEAAASHGSLLDVADLGEALTRFAVSTVRCGRFSLSTHAVLEPGSLVPACAAASAPRAVSMSATCMHALHLLLRLGVI